MMTDLTNIPVISPYTVWWRREAMAKLLKHTSVKVLVVFAHPEQAILVDKALPPGKALRTRLPEHGVLIWWYAGKDRILCENDLKYANITVGGEMHLFRRGQVAMWFPGWSA